MFAIAIMLKQFCALLVIYPNIGEKNKHKKHEFYKVQTRRLLVVVMLYYLAFKAFVHFYLLFCFKFIL